MIQIGAILSKPECAAIAEALGDAAVWIDGAATAKGAAANVKNNRQADPGAPAVKGAVQKIANALLANAVFRAAAQPAQFARIILNRYGPGEAYGDHVDAAYIDGVRTDLSFTLFLSDPSDYEGGELSVAAAGRMDAIKGGLGDLALYPSSAVHRVEAVRSGERFACVGWVKSRIRSPEHRAIVFELDQAIAQLRGAAAGTQADLRLANVRNNLLRAFGD